MSHRLIGHATGQSAPSSILCAFNAARQVGHAVWPCEAYHNRFPRWRKATAPSLLPKTLRRSQTLSGAWQCARRTSTVQPFGAWLRRQVSRIRKADKMGSISSTCGQKGKFSSFLREALCRPRSAITTRRRCPNATWNCPEAPHMGSATSIGSPS